MKERISWIKIVLLGACFFLFQSCVGTIFWTYVLTRPTGDVRPDEIRISKKETRLDTLNGQRILEEYLEKHLVFWHEVDSYKVETKAFYEKLAAEIFCPFPDNRLHMELTYIPADRKHVKGRILSGEREGQVWELRNGMVLIHKKGGSTLMSGKGNPLHPINRKRKIEYWMRFYGRMIELPLTLQEYELKSYIDQVDSAGRVYDRLLVSSKQGARSKDYDQYVVWLNEGAQRVDKVDLTFRQLTKWLEGTLYFTDFQSIEGIAIPARVDMKTFKKKKPYFAAHIDRMVFYMKSGEVKEIKKTP